jgi:hypothetical protein
MKATAFKESAQDVLFVLKIDMGSGRHSFINFCQSDSPDTVALAFCKTHGLSIKTYDFLVDTLNQKRSQVVGRPPQPAPQLMKGDFGFGAPVESVEYPIAEQRSARPKANERAGQKSSERAVSGKRPPLTSATSNSERNLAAKWKSPPTSSETPQTETDEKLLQDKIGEYYEVKPKGTWCSADVYDRLYFHAKSKQTVDPLAESRSLVSVLPRPKSSDPRSRSVSGTQASNRLYYCGLKNKSIRE